jgi:hypothetical protein
MINDGTLELAVGTLPRTTARLVAAAGAFSAASAGGVESTGSG